MADSPTDLQKSFAAGLRACLRIFDAWSLAPEQQRAVLGLPRQTYYRWRSQPDSARPDVNIRERISYVLGIYKALHELLPDAQAADGWLHRANAAPLFGGRAPLERLTAGQVADLYELRRFVDGLRG